MRLTIATRVSVAVTAVALGMLGTPLATPAGAASADTATTRLVIVDTSSGTPTIDTTTVLSSNVSAAEQQLETGPNVVVFPDTAAIPLSIDDGGNDPLRATQWALDEMGVDAVHGEGIDGAGQLVAVIDTGIYAPHEDLAGQIANSYDTMPGVPGWSYHGTAVAGIIAANSGNGIGVESIAPGAKLLDVRVCQPTSCLTSDVLDGIVWAVQHGATVINLSLGGSGTDVAPVLAWARAQGVVVVAAAGNNGCSLTTWNVSSWVPNPACTAGNVAWATTWPAADPDVIAVGAVQQDGTVPSYSSYGAYVDVAAPTGVMTTQPGGYESDFGGTSASAPHVAALAALILQADTALTPDQVQAVIQATADAPTQTPTHPLWNPDFATQDTTTITPRMLVGAGVADAQKAVDLALSWNTRSIAPEVMPGDHQLAVSWADTGGATSYDVLLNGTTAITSATTSATVTGLDNYRQYAVEVDAMSDTGVVLSRSQLTLATPDDQPTLIPIHITSLTAHNGPEVDVTTDSTWSGGRDLYLYRTDQPGTPVATYSGAPGPGTTGFPYTQLGTGPVTYYVTWVDSARHESPPSNTLSAGALPDLLPAPTNLTVTTGDTTATVSWDAVPGAGAYLYYNPLSGANETTTQTSVTFTGLTDAWPYSTSVAAKLTDDGNVNSSNGYTSSTHSFYAMPPRLATPAFTVTESTTGLTVTWTPVPGATTYNLYRNDGYSQGTFPNQTSQFYPFGLYGMARYREYEFRMVAMRDDPPFYPADFSDISDAVVGGSLASPPVNAAPPVVSGTDADGHTLSTTDGSWTGPQPIAFTYQWQRCDTAGENCADIAGAIGIDYQLGTADVGNAIRIVVTATNTQGSTSAASAPTARIRSVPDAPSITSLVRGDDSVAVTFTDGADNGSPVTAHTATCISGDGGNTRAATGSSPITVSSLTNGLTYTCTVHSTNAAGDSAESPASISFVAVSLPLVPTSVVATRANLALRVAFTVRETTGSPITAFSANCSSSNGGTRGNGRGASSPITVAGLTNGKTYTCTVRGTNAIGDSSDSAPSAGVRPGILPKYRTVPAITGSPVNHLTLTANDGSWTGAPTAATTRRWQRCNLVVTVCVDIPGSVGHAYVLRNADLHHKIRVVVTATNALGSATSPSACTPAIRSMAAAHLASRNVRARAEQPLLASISRLATAFWRMITAW